VPLIATRKINVTREILRLWVRGYPELLSYKDAVFARLEERVKTMSVVSTKHYGRKNKVAKEGYDKIDFYFKRLIPP
jgi:hypothetical protein